jgi:hypothetical protein
MPSIRVGFSSDFTLGNQLVGVGTTSAVRRLNVIGAIKGDFETLGVSTLSVYEGFVPEFQNVSIASTIGFSTSGVGTFVQVTESETGYLSLSGEFNSASEDIVVDEGRIFEVSIGSTATLGSLESISVQSHFSVPNGGTSTRPADPVEGMVRFNDDLNTLEFWNGFEWRQFTVTGASGRGVFGGGTTPTGVIDYINISSTGNAINFGRLTTLAVSAGGCSSSTRGVFAGGYFPTNPTIVNTIEYITIASEGNSIDFGDLTRAIWQPAGASSSTRGLFIGGFPRTNVIDYIQISTIGNALDFGDLFTGRYGLTGFSSPVRAIVAGDDPPSSDLIEFILIASKGNGVRFGELTQKRRYMMGCSNSVRGLFAGGGNPGPTNTIEYVTIASEGDAIDFGDLTVARYYSYNGAASSTRGVFSGGGTNTLDYVTITSAGNAQDFGDLTIARNTDAGISDSHGGLGGF